MMLMIQITEDDPDSTYGSYDGLPTFLAQQGIPPDLITHALDQLRQIKTLLLCKPSEDTEWEMREA